MASYSGSGSGSGGGGGGCKGGVSSCSAKSKKTKQKKVPQRGLGVAQLERIREEEQKKREAVQGEMGSLSENNPTFPVQCPNTRPHLPSIPNFANLHRSSGQNQKPLSAGEISTHGHGNFSGGYNLEGDKQRELTFLPEVNLPREVLNFHTLHHRSHIFQYSPNAMVNATSGISASLLSSQMEPPSNQSFRDDNYTASCSEADKMVIGVKRSYPFSLETTPVSSCHSNFPTFAASRSRSDDLASFNNGYMSQMESKNKFKSFSREGPSNSSPVREQDPTEAVRDNERLNEHFLTLAPPAAASPPSNSKHLLSQEKPRNQIHQLGSGESSEQPFCFFPEKLAADETSSPAEKRAAIDLNLKL